MNLEKFYTSLDLLSGEKYLQEEKRNNTELEHLEEFKKLKDEIGKGFPQHGVYPNSINFCEGSWLFIRRDKTQKFLVVYGKNTPYDELEGLEGTINNKPVKTCRLNNKNCKIITEIFPFTKPSNHKGKKTTIGLGDRLGLASPGHIRLIKDKEIFPVLAQQSIRELNLTGRTYEDVLCDASWAVFQEGYTRGFGADGDHLKTTEEVEMALENGFTMITLDCSEHINNEVTGYSPDEINRRYKEIDEKERNHLESLYLNKSIKIKGDTTIEFGPQEFKKIVLIYLKAIKYTINIYDGVIRDWGRDIDFEMSIDETLTPTTPESHYFVASELISKGVEITSLAPRFCGEFQKGIDYVGDITQFKKEFKMHANIAENFGYKISVHSGSDKFAVFPIIGEITKNKYHLKTAGTNWLEAVRVIAAENPQLYRKMHKFAIKHLDEAKKYYQISGTPGNIPDIDKLEDKDLPGLMDKDDSRQVMHITYGLILMEKNTENSFAFKDEIYSTLYKFEEEYYFNLIEHIGKHTSTLRI